MSNLPKDCMAGLEGSELPVLEVFQLILENVDEMGALGKR